jgi:hypothetical protein
MRITLILVSLILASCTDLAINPKLNPDEEVQEAVFRYQMAEFNPASLFKFYYVAIAVADTTHHFVGHHDPSRQLLNRFAGNVPPVKMYSEASVAGTVTDKQTGDRGVLFRAAAVQWISSDVVQVDGGSYIGSRGADTFLYYMSRRNGVWAVDSTRWLWSW